MCAGRGYDLYMHRTNHPIASHPASDVIKYTQGNYRFMESDELDALADAINDCMRCALGGMRNRAVPGEGNADAELMFVGEAPGRQEDLRGRPFVGAAGRILDEMLGQLCVTRTEVFIGNILKCRPPGNRDPVSQEIERCTPYLARQIDLIRPEILCPLGNFAIAYILHRYGIQPQSISRVHGTIFEARDGVKTLRIVPLYHPAALIYNPKLRTVMQRDLELVRRFL